jgi:hypothetical protein
MIKERIGQMRGFRIIEDPDGVLLGNFDFNGLKMGYLLFPEEGHPAIFDGEAWISIFNEAGLERVDADLPGMIKEQNTKLTSAALTNSAYVDTARALGLIN